MTKLSLLSIIVSVYNEERALNHFYTAFKKISYKFNWDYELIFVNDGSNDSSLSILHNIAQENSNVKVLSFSRNFGHEAAMIAGIDYSTGDGIICMDADLQHPLECIFPIVEKFNEGYDIINMIRLTNRSAGFIKNITSKAFYTIINLLADYVHFEENASDFFAINRKVAEILKKYYRGKIRFLRGYVQSVGFKRTALEYIAAERAAGTSHYNIKTLIKFSVNAMICFSNLPLKLGVYLGLINAFLGVIILIHTLYTYNSAQIYCSMIIIALCFWFSILFIILGIIGEYLAAMFSEIKDKPIYIVDQEINFSHDKK